MEMRVRIGQGMFRAKLLSNYGENCALTGPSILGALDAAHIVQYATTGVHHEAEGLLLRKDLHALVDRKLIGLDPDAWRVRVSPLLYHVKGYRELDGARLLVPRVPRLEASLERLFSEYASASSR
jgi:predicted restriction endonuclease